MISQHTKYNADFKLLEYTEKDSEGKTLFTEKYDGRGRIIYRSDGKGNFEEYKYTGIPFKIFHMGDLGSLANLYSVKISKFGGIMEPLPNKRIWVDDVLYIQM